MATAYPGVQVYTAARVVRCRSCGSRDTRRSPVRNGFDHFLRMVSYLPYRCRVCNRRFHAAAPAPADRE